MRISEVDRLAQLVAPALFASEEAALVVARGYCGGCSEYDPADLIQRARAIVAGWRG